MREVSVTLRVEGTFFEEIIWNSRVDVKFGQEITRAVVADRLQDFCFLLVLRPFDFLQNVGYVCCLTLLFLAK